MRTGVRSALFTALQTNIPVGAKFETGGIYLNTRVIDIGAAVQPAQNYNLAVNGRVNFGGTVVQVPGVNRQLIRIPPLGTEVLWPGPPPTQDAPVAVVVSTPMNWPGAPTGTGWQGPNPPVHFQGGTPGNCASIGVVLVFENFIHFTAGDLPSQGEDPIGDALLTDPLPDGGGGHFQVLDSVVNLKCSHHGSAASTSDYFVTTIQPMAAMLSCGHKHSLPAQRVIDTLYNGNVPRFWLTNCSYPRAGVPFSAGNNQRVPGNRAFVAGDNVLPNTTAGRARGDITIFVTEAGASAAAGARHYQVQYWEQSAVPPAVRACNVQW